MEDNRNAAASIGDITFYTGKECKHGHKSERYTSSYNCVMCTKALYKIPEYQEKNRQNARKFRDKDKQKNKEYMREYMQKRRKEIKDNEYNGSEAKV